MADPASTSVMRDLVEKAVLAAVGAVALTAERADDLADELARRGGMTRDEAKRVIDEQTGRWRGEATRVGERAGASFQGVFRELGLVTRDEHSELELRVAQLEHRLRLLEGETTRALGTPEPGESDEV
jgi:polyhydroxyalkanoate synthesis regulator phasin